MKYKIRENEEVQVYKRLPKGWKITEGTMTEPVGTRWASNGEPFFVKDKSGKYHKNLNYRQALVVTDEKLMIERIAEKRRTGEDFFISDKKTEEKIRAETRRQVRERKQIEQERKRQAEAAQKRKRAAQEKKEREKRMARYDRLNKKR